LPWIRVGYSVFGRCAAHVSGPSGGLGVGRCGKLAVVSAIVEPFEPVEGGEHDI